MEMSIEALPDVPDLMKKLGQPDAVFDAWRDRQSDKSWVRLDLSALRVGYELGLRSARYPDAPSDAAALNKACDAYQESAEAHGWDAEIVADVLRCDDMRAAIAAVWPKQPNVGGKP